MVRKKTPSLECSLKNCKKMEEKIDFNYKIVGYEVFKEITKYCNLLIYLIFSFITISRLESASEISPRFGFVYKYQNHSKS